MTRLTSVPRDEGKLDINICDFRHFVTVAIQNLLCGSYLNTTRKTRPSARGKNCVQCEAPPGDIRKKLMKLVTVYVEGNAVVGRGTVEFLEEKSVVSMGIIEGAGKKQLQTVLELIAVADTALV